MKILIIFFFCFPISFQTSGQSWQPETDAKVNYLQHLFFNEFDGVLKKDSSTYFVFTSHHFNQYWKKKNKSKSETLVSNVDERGNITFIKKLDYYVDNSIKKVFNDRFYILGTTSISTKGKYYYPLFIYNSNWQLQKQLFLSELTSDHQRGFIDFVVDNDGNIYLTTSPYFLDHRQEDFKGSFLIKSDTSGNFIKRTFFEKSFLRNLQLTSDTLSLTADKQKLVYHFYQADSVILFKLTKSFNCLSQVAKQVHIKDNNNNNLRTVYLKNGEKVIFIDSSYNIAADTWTYSHKIAVVDKADNRKWTYETPENFIVSHSTVTELRDGTFLIEIFKKWIIDRVYDTACIVQFDMNGNQKQIKTFLDGANPGMESYFVSSFFEAKQNEVWLFYRKSFPNRQERIYFERLVLPK